MADAQDLLGDGSSLEQRRAAAGAVLAAAETAGEAVIVAELDASEIVASRSAYPMWADRRPELFGALGLRR